MTDGLERSLLFGILAVREHLVNRATLVEGMKTWIEDESRDLEQIIRDRHRLTDEQVHSLRRTVARVLARAEAGPRPGPTEVDPGVACGGSLPTLSEDGLGHRWSGEPTVDMGDSSGSIATLVPASDANRGRAATAPGSPEVRYRIHELLARGGLGEVYVARDEELDRLVALKLMQDRWADDASSRRRFLREAGITSALEHPGIVPVHGLGVLPDGRPYYAMKLVKGVPFNDAIEAFHQKHQASQDSAGRTSELRQLLRRFLDVCHVIDYAHSREIIHRDLKPANILLGEYAETLVVDWGLAKYLGRGVRAKPSGAAPDSDDSTLGSELANSRETMVSDQPHGGLDHETLPGSTLGTPNYMSPEQAAGATDKVGPASDIYGLGATLYFLLTGVPPCDGPDLAAVLAKVRAGEITPPLQLRAWVPAPLAAICMRAMAPRPEDRYDSPRALAGDVERWLADDPVAIHRDPISVRLTRWGRRHRTLAVAFGVLLISAVFGLTLGNLLLSQANRRTDQQRRVAEGTADTLERQLYIHRVNLAHRECLEGNISEVERLLSLCPEPARDWEWYYVARLCHRERFGFRGHRESVNAVAFTPDGTKVLSGSGRPFYQAHRNDAAELILWDPATGREVKRFGPLNGAVHGVAVSPDGKWVASASGFYDRAPGGEGRLRVWDASTGEVVLERTKGYVNALAVAFSPDSRHVAVGFGLLSTSDYPGDFMVFEVSTRKVVLEHRFDAGGVNAVAFHPDGKRLAVGGTGAIELWDITRNEKLHKLSGHTSWVFSVAFSRDGGRLVSGGWDRTVRTWDLASATESRRIDAHSGIVLGVAFSPDGTKIASCGDDNALKLWDAGSGRLLATYRGHASQMSGILALAFSPDGNTLASAGGDRAVMLWDVSSGEQTTFHDRKGWITSLIAMPDNRTVISGSGDHSIALWDADSGRLIRDLGRHVDWVLCLALSPDGKLLASGGADNAIQLWNLATGEGPRPFHGSGSFVRGLAFSPDGKTLVSAGGDQSHGPTRGEILVWDLATGKPARRVLEEARSCNRLAFSPDGRTLAVAVNSREGPDPIPSKVVLLDWPSGRVIRTIVDPYDPAAGAADTPAGSAIAFSPDGARLAVDGWGGAVRIFDPRTGVLERTLRGHNTQIGALLFSPSGRRLVSSSFDRLIKVWDTSTGEELLSLRGHDGGVVSLAFSPDGHRLFSGGVDHTARVWDARPLERSPDMNARNDP